MPRRIWFLVAMTALVALAAGLRFYKLGAQPLWLDEATTADYAAKSLLSATFAEGTHPPLFYVIEYFAVRWLGPSDAALRVPSALFGLLMVPAAWAVARRLVPQSRATAWATAALVATSPFLLYLSQDARSYPLLILLALLSTVYFLRFCGIGDSGEGESTVPRGRAADLLLYAALSVLMLYTHYYAVWVLLAREAVYWRHARVQQKAWLLARFNVALAFLPWVVWAAGQAKLDAIAWAGSALVRIPYALLRDLVGYSIAPHAAPGPGNDTLEIVVREEGLAVALVAGPLLWLLLRGAWRVRNERPATCTLLLALLVAPLVIMVAVSPWVKLLHERAVSFQTPFVLLLIAYGWATLRPRARVVSAIVCSAGIAFSLVAYYAAPGELLGYRLRYGKEEWRAAAAYVEESKPDAVILAPGYLHLSFLRYWRVSADAVPVLQVARGAELNWPWRVHASRRIALVLSHAGPAEERVREHLDATRQRVAEINFPAQNGIRVYVYESRTPPD